MEALAFQAPDDGAVTLEDGTRVWIHARAKLPTRYGDFEAVAFRNSRDGQEHLALVRGTPGLDDAVPLRLHSECLTGDALGSVRCDCRAQLESAQADLGRRDHGVLLYLRQEGRGIGLANKIAAYALQDQGLDTLDANLHLGFDADLRTYDLAAAMLQLLGVEKTRLFTNNPAKVLGLTDHGIEVVERVPLQVGASPHNEGYLRTKRERFGHHL